MTPSPQLFVHVFVHLRFTLPLHNYIPRVSLTILSAQETQHIPWADKDPRVFFRGRDSNKVRLELVKRHRTNTAMFDVGIVAWFFFEHDEATYGPVAKRVGFNEFFKVPTDVITFT